MLNIGRLVGKLPFSGKITIRDRVIALRASRNQPARKTAFISLMRLLAWYILTHLIQMMLGVWGMTSDTPLFVQVFFGLYMTANALATIAQFDITVRSVWFYYHGAFPTEEKNYPDYSFVQTLVPVLFTISGQVIMAILWFSYVITF